MNKSGIVLTLLLSLLTSPGFAQQPAEKSRDQKEKAKGTAQEKPKDDFTLLQGKWRTIVKVGPKGKQLAKDDLRHNQVLEVEGNVLRLTVQQPDAKPLLGTFKLTPTDSPKLFDLSGTGPLGFEIELHGIYELSDDTFRLSVVQCGSGKPFTRPQEFDGERGGDYSVFKRSVVPPEVEVNQKQVTGGPRIVQKQTWTWAGSKDNYAKWSDLTFEVGMGNRKDGMGCADAGIEIEKARYLRVSMTRQQSYTRIEDNSFGGFFVDYHTNDGYSKRVALSMGVYSYKRSAKTPTWGKFTPPDHLVNLGTRDVYDLDLKKWAPARWDGKVWLTVSLQNSGFTSIIRGSVSVTVEEDRALATKLAGARYTMACDEMPRLQAHWDFTRGNRAIQNGKDWGPWEINGGKLIITYSDKQFGRAVLDFKDDNTLVGKNIHRNGAVFNWILTRQTIHIAQSKKELPVQPPNPTGGKPRTNVEKIIGVWKRVEKPGGKVPNYVWIEEFGTDGQMRVTLGPADKTISARGTYKVEGDNLTVMFPGQQPVMVKIKVLTDQDFAIEGQDRGKLYVHEYKKHATQEVKQGGQQADKAKTTKIGQGGQQKEETDKQIEVEKIRKTARLYGVILRCDSDQLESIMLDWHRNFELSWLDLSSVLQRLKTDGEEAKLTGDQALQALRLSRVPLSNLHKAGKLAGGDGYAALINIIRLNVQAVATKRE